MQSAVRAQDLRTSSGPSMARLSARAPLLACHATSKALSGGDILPIPARRLPRPAHERAMKSAHVREAQQERHLRDRRPVIGEVALSQLSAHLVGLFGEGGAFAPEPALERTSGQAQ